MSEFEDLKLTVTLTDEASAGLAALRSQMTQVAQTADQATTSLAGIAQGFQQISGAAAQVTPAVRQTNISLRDLTRSAEGTSRGMMQMVLSMRGGLGSFPQLALGLREAVVGLRGMSEGMAQLAPAMHDTVLGIGAIAVGATAIVTTVVAAGVTLFKFSQGFSQMSQTAKAMGLSFADVQNAIDIAEHYGTSQATIISNLNGIAQAQNDLWKGGSQLRQDLLKEGIDSEFIGELKRETDPAKFQQLLHRRFTYERDFLMKVRGYPLAAANAAVNKTLKERFGLDSEFLSRPEPRGPTPAEKVRYDSVEEQSKKINKAWADISRYIRVIGATIADWGIGSLVLPPLQFIQRIFYEIRAEVGRIREKLKIVWNSAPGQLARKTVRWAKGWKGFSGGKDDDTLGGLIAPPHPGDAAARRTFELRMPSLSDLIRGMGIPGMMRNIGRGPMGSGASSAPSAPSAPSVPQVPYYGSVPGTKLQHGGSAYSGRPYLVGERGPELMVPHTSGTVMPRASFTADKAVEATERDTTETARLNEQISKLNSFFARSDEKTGAGAKLASLTTGNIPGVSGGGYGGGPQPEEDGGGRRGGTRAPAETPETPAAVPAPAVAPAGPEVGPGGIPVQPGTVAPVLIPELVPPGGDSGAAAPAAAPAVPAAGPPAAAAPAAPPTAGPAAVPAAAAPAIPAAAAPTVPAAAPAGGARAAPAAGGAGAAQGGIEKIAVGKGGAVDPSSLYRAAVQRIRGGPLDGFIPADGAKYGITKGTPEEWAKVLVANAHQESSMNANPPPEKPGAPRAGLFQFAPEDLRRRGLGTDVTDPDKQLQAAVKEFEKSKKAGAIRGTAGGKWGGAAEYFGSIRRERETLKHMPKAERAAAAAGAVPTTAAAPAAAPAAPAAGAAPSAGAAQAGGNQPGTSAPALPPELGGPAQVPAAAAPTIPAAAGPAVDVSPDAVKGGRAPQGPFSDKPSEERRVNYFQGRGDQPIRDRSQLAQVKTPYGTLAAHPEAAADLKRFTEAMKAAGAPIKNFGDYNLREKRAYLGGRGWSSHAFGAAWDIDNATSLSPAMKAWIRDNPEKFKAALKAGNMRQPLPGTDAPHIEWTGPGKDDANRPPAVAQGGVVPAAAAPAVPAAATGPVKLAPTAALPAAQGLDEDVRAARPATVEAPPVQDLDAGRASLDRAAVDKKNGAAEATSKVAVNIRAPAGTKVEYKGDNLLKATTVERTTPIEEAGVASGMSEAA